MERLKEYRNKLATLAYPTQGNYSYTTRQRWEIYRQLTKEQRQVIDEERRYLVRSQFIQENFLAASDWQFEDFKVNPAYKTNLPQIRLFCECGREIKFQYILRSKATDEVLNLGIQHFADHLQVAKTVATAVNQGMHQVDIGLDELLWLKKQGTSFPNKLWEAYCYVVFQNGLLTTPQQINQPLAKRVAVFAQADLPIYLADFQAVKEEFYRLADFLEKHPRQLANVPIKDYQESFAKLLQQATFDYEAFVSKRLEGLQTETAAEPYLPSDYFEELAVFLESVKEATAEEADRTLATYYQTGIAHWIQPQVYQNLIFYYQKYGFTASFFYSIPRVMRNGLLNVLKKRQSPQPLAPKDWGKCMAEQSQLSNSELVSLLQEKKQTNLTTEEKQAIHLFREWQGSSPAVQDLIRKWLKS